MLMSVILMVFSSSLQAMIFFCLLFSLGFLVCLVFFWGYSTAFPLFLQLILCSCKFLNVNITQTMIAFLGTLYVPFIFLPFSLNIDSISPTCICKDLPWEIISCVVQKIILVYEAQKLFHMFLDLFSTCLSDISVFSSFPLVFKSFWIPYLRSCLWDKIEY